MITIPEHIKTEIWAHGAAAYPYEGCGLLLGRVENGENIVEQIRPMTNVWPDQEEKRVRFRIDEGEWISAEIAAANANLDIIGIFHSHPDCDAIASPRDLAWAAFSGYSYLITEVRDGNALGSRSWQLNKERTNFAEEEVRILRTAQ